MSGLLGRERSDSLHGRLRGEALVEVVSEHARKLLVIGLCSAGSAPSAAARRRGSCSPSHRQTAVHRHHEYVERADLR